MSHPNCGDPIHKAVLAEMNERGCEKSEALFKFNGGNVLTMHECMEHGQPWNIERDECSELHTLMLAGWRAGAKFTRRGVINQILGMLADMSQEMDIDSDIHTAYEAIASMRGEPDGS